MRIRIILFLAAFLSTGTAFAAETSATDSFSMKELLSGVLAGIENPEDRNRAIKDALFDVALDNIDVANGLLRSVSSGTTPLGRLFEDLNIELKAFESDDNDKDTALGVGYDYEKAARKEFRNEANRFSGLKGSFSARGNVAFQSSKNPRDFLETKLSLAYFSSRGGVLGETDEAFAQELNDLEDKLVEYEDLDALLNSAEWRRFKDLTADHLTDQFYYAAAIDAGLESDQKFDVKQFTFGLDIGLIPRGWGEKSFLGSINVFDYIPALIRVWSGQDKSFIPRGSGFPTVNLGFDRVQPQDEDPRNEAGDDSDFWRYDIEIGFSSLLGRWNGANVTWENNFRHYAEINADDTTEDAGLDDYTYFVSAVTMANGMFISYSTGELPFDTKSDQVYEVGLKYRF